MEAVREADDGRPVAGLRGRRVGRREVAAAERAVAPRAGRGRRAGAQRRVRRARRRRAALRPAGRRAAAAGRARATRRCWSCPPQARHELGALLPGLAERRRGAAGNGRSVDSERRSQAQSRLFEALLGALDRLARDAPVVLIVEDVHWADRSTRDFLSFLGRNLADERVLVALSYRPDELHRRHPLRPLLAVLERTPHARRIELAGLTADDVRAMAHEMPGSEPSERAGRAAGAPLRRQRAVRRGAAGRRARPAAAVAGRRADGPRRAAAGRRAGGRPRAVGRPARRPRVVGVLGGPRRRARCGRRCATRSPATSSPSTAPTATSSATCCCARSSTTTCCPASAPSCTARSRARWRRGCRATAGRGWPRRSPTTSTAPATSRRRCAPRSWPPTPPTAAHAEADAAQFLERALELWERVVEPEALIDAERMDHVDLLMRHGARAPQHRRRAPGDAAQRGAARGARRPTPTTRACRCCCSSARWPSGAWGAARRRARRWTSRGGCWPTTRRPSSGSRWRSRG